MNALLEAGILNEKILEGLYNISKYLPEYGCEIFIASKINIP
jgi:hypothetical protein